MNFHIATIKNKQPIKNFYTLLLIILALKPAMMGQVPFSGTSGNFTTDSKLPIVILMSPNGGESYYITDPLPVEWTTTDDGLSGGPITILVSTDGGVNYNAVASGLPNASPVNVTAPLVMTNQAKVKVIAQDIFGLTGYDESNGIFSLQGIIVNLKAYLESPILPDSSMRTDLNSGGYIPLLQPYYLPPWNYTGTESVISIPNPDVVDWVLVELGETVGDATTAYADNVIARQADFVFKNVIITSIDGVSSMFFHTTSSQNLFAVVWHRNHIPVHSATSLVLSNGNYNYNFTSNENKAYGGALAYMEIGLGIRGMITGDGDANGVINSMHKSEIYN